MPATLLLTHPDFKKPNSISALSLKFQKAGTKIEVPKKLQTSRHLDTKSLQKSCIDYRDVTAGVTGATAVTPKFSATLTLFQPDIAEVAPKTTETENEGVVVVVWCQICFAI